MSENEWSYLLAKRPRSAGFGLGTANVARLVTFASSFSEGWDLTIFGVVLVPITEEFGLRGLHLGLVVSLPLCAGVFGYLLTGLCMDHVGRKPTIIASYVTCCIGCLAMSMATGVATLGIGRGILSFGIKAGVTCSSVYMTELSPAGRRGVLVSLEELYINAGILCATAASWALLGNGVVTWRGYAAAGSLAPALALVCFLLLDVPESPRFQEQRGRHEEALATLRGALAGNEAEVDRTLEFWQQEAAARKAARSGGPQDLACPWWGFTLQRGFLIASACWFARAASGIALVGSYFTLFLRGGGMSQRDCLWWYTIGSVAKTLALVPSCLWLIDFSGRRGLFLISAAACALSMASAAALGFNGMQVVPLACCMVCFFMSFSVGYGPVVWVYCTEILPSEQRGLAVACSQAPGDVLSFALLTVGPVLHEAHPALPFMITAVTNVFAAVFFWASCPETRGLVLEEAKDAVL